MGKRHHKNTILRMQHVREIVRQHYESGNLAKCYKQVWRHYVYPKYPMCYRTFLSYLNLSDAELQAALREEDEGRNSATPRYYSPTLFDFND